MSQEFQAPRGTLDWYGGRAALRRSVLDAAREVFESAGYSQVVTPTFEDTGVFARTSGEGSDVVRKEMYSFTDRSGRPLTLRPEGTAGVMRAYLEHMTRLPQPVKVWYEVPMFRYAAVQKGRYREHYQFGAEVIGSGDAAVEWTRGLLGAGPVVTYAWLSVDDDGDAARRRLAPVIASWREMNLYPTLFARGEPFAVAGTPEECAQAVAGLSADAVALVPLGDPDEQFERLAAVTARR